MLSCDSEKGRTGAGDREQGRKPTSMKAPILLVVATKLSLERRSTDNTIVEWDLDLQPADEE
jgi:hypothetical protein